MKTKTRVKAGGLNLNHNEALIRDVPKTTTLRVKTQVKAGIMTTNHNETLVRDTRRKG